MKIEKNKYYSIRDRKYFRINLLARNKVSTLQSANERKIQISAKHKSNIVLDLLGGIEEIIASFRLENKSSEMRLRSKIFLQIFETENPTSAIPGRAHALLVRVHALLVRVHALSVRVHALLVRVHGLLVRVHALLVRVHALSVRIHALSVRVHALSVRVHALSVRVHALSVRIHAQLSRIPAPYG